MRVPAQPSGIAGSPQPRREPLTAELIPTETAGRLAPSVRLESMDRVLSREHRLVARLFSCAGSDRFEQEVFHVQWIVPIVEQRCCRHIGDRLVRLAVEHEEPVAEVEKIL
jgi:hypothetical protein